MFLIQVIVANIVFMFLIERTLSIFFEERRTPFYLMWASYLLGTLVVSSNALFFDPDASYSALIFPMLVILIAKTMVTFNYKASMLRRVAAVSGLYLLNMIYSLLASVIMYLLYPSIPAYSGDYGAWIVATSISGLLVYVILQLCIKKFTSIRKNTLDSKAFLFSVFTITFSIFLTFFWVESTTTTPGVSVPLGVGFLLLVILFSIGFLLLSQHDSVSKAHEVKIQSALYAQEKEYYLVQCQMMQESVEQMKSFRHDVKNHLATLKSYSLKNQIDDIANYLNDLIGDIDIQDTYSETGNLAFDSIINYKLKSAKEQDIKLDINLFIPKMLNIEIIDVVTILGNLLDNALDSVAKVDEKIVKLNIKFEKNGLFIKIDNSFNGEVKYKNEMTESKKQLVSLKNSNKHGYGLKNINQSVDKYNGHIEITHTDNIFTVGIALFGVA